MNRVVQAVEENIVACERILQRKLTPEENRSILKMVLILQAEIESLDKPK